MRTILVENCPGKAKGERVEVEIGGFCEVPFCPRDTCFWHRNRWIIKSNGIPVKGCFQAGKFEEACKDMDCGQVDCIWRYRVGDTL